MLRKHLGAFAFPAAALATKYQAQALARWKTGIETGKIVAN